VSVHTFVDFDVWGVCHIANRRGSGCLNCVTFVIRDLGSPGM